MFSMDRDQELIFEAKLCEQCELYDEMKEKMRELVMLRPQLETEERNLLSVAYKNVVGIQRSALRICGSFMLRYEQGDQDLGAHKQGLVKAFREKTKEKLHGICHEAIDLLDKQLIPAVKYSEPTPLPKERELKVFYYKMKGDYNRYLVESEERETKDGQVHGASREDFVKSSESAYDAATKEASELESTNPIRLGLALNFSVFHYEIKDDQEEACRLAKKAFDDAIAELDTLSEDSYKDSTLIMQLIRDNLTLWTSDDRQSDEGNPNEEGEQ